MRNMPATFWKWNAALLGNALNFCWFLGHSICYFPFGGRWQWEVVQTRVLLRTQWFSSPFQRDSCLFTCIFLIAFVTWVLIVPLLDINHTLHLALKQILISWSNWCANEVREGQHGVHRCVTGRIRLFCFCAMPKYWSKLSNALPGTNEMTLVENRFYRSVSSDYQIVFPALF